jgi:hypothetical protein
MADDSTNSPFTTASDADKESNIQCLKKTIVAVLDNEHVDQSSITKMLINAPEGADYITVVYTVEADMGDDDMHQTLLSHLEKSITDGDFDEQLDIIGAQEDALLQLQTAQATMTMLLGDFSRSGDNEKDKKTSAEMEADEMFNEWFFLVLVLLGIAIFIIAFYIYNCSVKRATGRSFDNQRFGEIAGQNRGKGAAGIGTGTSLYSRSQNNRNILRPSANDDGDGDFEIHMIQTDTGFRKQRIRKSEINTPKKEYDPFGDILNPIDDSAFGAPISTSNQRQQPVLDIFADDPPPQPPQQKVAYADEDFADFASFGSSSAPPAAASSQKNNKNAQIQHTQHNDSDVSDFVL